MRRLFLLVLVASILGCGKDEEAIRRSQLVQIMGRIHEALLTVHDGKKSTLTATPTIDRLDSVTGGGKLPDTAAITYAVDPGTEIHLFRVKYNYVDGKWLLLGVEVRTPKSDYPMILTGESVRASTDPVSKAMLSE